MPLAYVEKIMDEITSEKFRKRHSIEFMSISQNGEALLNKDMLPILRLVKGMAPEIKVRIFTNFSHLTKDKAQILLGEGLIYEFNCNIDGHTDSSYFNTKKLDLKTTKQNLLD